MEATASGTQMATPGTASGFGVQFTPTMTTISYRDGEWGPTIVGAFESLCLSPAAMVLHYGQAIFEGLKAYRHPDGGVALFRAEKNAERLAFSAARMSMPELPTDRFMEALRLQVEADREFVPSEDGSSLYLRPFMIAVEPTLGTRPSREYLFIVIASPSGPYFGDGVRAITVAVGVDHPRAFPGGTGSAKCAGNYAAGMLAQREAAAAGADQVIFLDAATRTTIEELGGMNVFFVAHHGDGTAFITPPLSDTILHGITRDALLVLAAEEGATVIERPISLDEVRSGAADGTIAEAFACGTAAAITPISKILGVDGQPDTVFGAGEPGEWSMKLRRRLLGIQQGEIADNHGWITKL